MNAAGILRGGADLVRTRPTMVAIWGLVYLVAGVVAFALVWPMFGELIALQQQAIAAQAANLPPPPPPAGFIGAVLMLDAVFLAAAIAIFAAVVRAVAIGGSDRFAFLRLGMDELRLLGLGIVLFLIAFVGMVVFVILAVLVVAALAYVFGPGALAGGMILYLAAVGATIWVQVRMSLAGALTVLRGRIVIREAWALTRGRFWTLFGMYLLIGVAFFAAGIVLVALISPDVFSAYAGGMQPQDMQAAMMRQQQLLSDPFGPRFVIGLVIGTVVNTVAVAFTCGAVATATIGFDRDRHPVVAP